MDERENDNKAHQIAIGEWMRERMKHAAYQSDLFFLLMNQSINQAVNQSNKHTTNKGWSTKSGGLSR